MFQFRIRTLFIFTAICAVIALVAVNFRMSWRTEHHSFELGGYEFIGPPGASGLPTIKNASGAVEWADDGKKRWGCQFMASSGVQITRYTIKWGEHKWKWQTAKLDIRPEQWPDPKLWELKRKGSYPFDYPE